MGSGLSWINTETAAGELGVSLKPALKPECRSPVQLLGDSGLALFLSYLFETSFVIIQIDFWLCCC